METTATPASALEAPLVESHAYAGVRRMADDKYWHVWYPEADLDGKIVVASKKARNVVPEAVIGHVYDFTLSDQGYYVAGPHAPRYAKRSAPPERVLAWEIADRAARTAQTLEQRAKRDGDKSEIDRALAPIAEAMRATNPQGRAAILAYVVTRLNDRYGIL